MTIDKSLLFKSHIWNAAAEAEKIDTQLSKIMPNVGGPREDRRRLLSSVVHSVLLYGAPSWGHTLGVAPVNVKLLNRTQRKILLRCTSAYCTVLEVASNVLSSTPPYNLLARERKAEFDVRRTGQDGLPRNELKRLTVAKWQARWDDVGPESPGQWTRRLIPNLTKWCARGFGRVDFHLSQFLSGHGCFGKYLCLEKSSIPCVLTVRTH
ncbi:uncharacterized protein LOC132947548 [Metopolophium dirhodum]|uniref:uncharacterized protein LOC132947548 n=1 Tax=Metopolophium dirhodum TaxID=44670 RepID=UPI00299046EA|nr:uncharacterized protein LOC132947548 [Metopolophium dirhodum]